MSKTAWILNHYAGHPQSPTGGSRHQSLARGLVDLGWEVTIFAASTDHRTREPREPRALSSSEHEGVGWTWIPSPRYPRGGLSRIRNMLAFTIGCLKRRHTKDVKRPDVVIGSSVHPLAAWAGLRLARRHRVPFVFEVRDLWPETLIDMGAISRSGPPARALRMLEKHLYNRASAIITTMPMAYEYITALGIPREKIHWVSNGINLENASITPPPMGKPFRFAYFGSHGRANDLEIIVEAFGRARVASSTPMELHLYGDGPARPGLRGLAAERGLSESVFFHDPVPQEQVLPSARAADALVVSLLPLRIYRFGISLNKVFDYLAAARPVLFIGDPVNNSVVESDCGLAILEHDVDRAAQAMLDMATSTESERARWGANGFAHVSEFYSYSALAERLDSLLTQVVDEQRRRS